VLASLWKWKQRFAVGETPGSARKVLRLTKASDDPPGQFPLVGVAKAGARFRVRLRQVLQLSSGFRLATRLKLTSMFALPAADVRVRRAIYSPCFAEPAGSSCTFRSPQPCATPAGHETESKLGYFHRFLSQQATSMSAGSSPAFASP